MSLELEIKALREAIEANTAALGGSESSGKTAGKAAGTKHATNKSSTGTTVDQVAKIVGGYLTEGDRAEKAEAKKNVMKIVEHFGAERVSLIDPAKFDDVLAMVEAYKEGEDPLDEGDDGASLM